MFSKGRTHIFAPAEHFLDGNGVEVCKKIGQSCPNTKILCHTSFSEYGMVLGAIQAGAQGYVLKEVGMMSLVESLKLVAAGLPVVDPMLAGHTFHAGKNGNGHGCGNGNGKQQFPGVLSPREHYVLSLVAEGKTNKEIATTLDLSEKTIKNYLGRVYQKINVSRRSQAATFFVRNFPM